MKRRTFIRAALAATALLSLPRLIFGNDGGNVVMTDKILRSETEWRKILTPGQFEVLRNEGTEPAFSSPLNKEYGNGIYVCAGCELPLFESSAKFDSGTGWPSFFKPIEGRIETKRDFKIIFPRTEYHCIRCGGHQGHVFNDGPEPTGQRWCNNGLALKFIPA
ncbi:MAG: peptide-methionine (R)-S-oxide reductase [Zetaproteobacteria bacterium CG_4_9_14_3_um_filter_53_7]|nr:MAG: peptide-methionine (R)-S-oxide reductase [Zetaproteobacteria bacterium CG_4_9_14_3_um_filter_53_7]